MSKTIVDLSHPYLNNTPSGDLDPDVAISQWKNFEELGYNMTKIEMNTHVGTHLDVPRHFFEDGKTISDYEVSHFIGDAVLADLGTRGAGYQIHLDELSPMEDSIASTGRVLINTNWDRVYPEKKFYAEAPGLSMGAVEYLLELDIELVGLDAPSINMMKPEENFESHRKLLGQEVIIVEGLRNMKSLPEDPFELVTVPINFANRDGAPTRAFAKF